MKCTRPALRYHGGKWQIAPWVISHFPKHKMYVESYGGAASVLLRKTPCKSEIWNDLNGVVYEVFSVLRDPKQSAKLIELLRLTPYARDEFVAAYKPTDDPIERVRRVIVRSFMGFGGDGTTGVYPTGFRATVTKAKKIPSHEWSTYPDALRAVVDRFQGVVIENRPAIEVMTRMDDPGVLHYIDPPYLPQTRSSGNRRRGKGFHVYEHEMELEDHIALLEVLRELKGYVVLSGYPSDLYDDALPGWRRVERQAWADGGRKRTECLWINPAADQALGYGTLLDRAA